MNNLKNISNFFFGKAEYHVGDRVGNKLLIRVDYKADKYDLVILKKSNITIENLKNEASKIALDLLKRKSMVNFARNN